MDMGDQDFRSLVDETQAAIAEGQSIAILGMTEIAVALIRNLTVEIMQSSLVGIFDASTVEERYLGRIPILSEDSIADHEFDVLIIAYDEGKIDAIQRVRSQLCSGHKLIFSGYGHFKFRDHVFEEILRTAIVPSLANGYPNCLVHLYQCLRNAAKRDVDGAILEFGTFKGGTTYLLSRFAHALERDWKVISFDTFNGFPKKRSALDMYAHPDCVFQNKEIVSNMLQGHNVEIVEGDIYKTCDQVRDIPVVLAFFDTDNYSATAKAIDVIVDNVVPGGAIVFDHFTGLDRFRYTLGERMAGQVLLEDARFVNLHGTGVFLRQ